MSKKPNLRIVQDADNAADFAALGIDDTPADSWLADALNVVSVEQYEFLNDLFTRLYRARSVSYATDVLNAVLYDLCGYAQCEVGHSRPALSALRLGDFDAVNNALSAALGIAPTQPQPEKANAQPPEPKCETWDTLRKDWIYVGQQQQFVRLADRKMWDVPALDKQFDYVRDSMEKFGKKPTVLSKAIFSCKPGHGLRTYDSFCFLPGQENVGNLFNSWRKSDIEPAAGNTDLWDAHLEYLFADPKERAHVLDWLAWVYQHQDEHPHHALLTHGAMQGTGKSFIFAVLSRLLGEHNTTLLDQTALDLDHDKWKINTKLLLIEEVRPAFGSSNATVKKLHPLISQDTMHVDMKNAHDFDMPNVMAMGLGSNKSDALNMDNSDRRYLIVSTDSAREDGKPLLPKPDAYYDALYGLLRDSGALGAIAQALLNRKLGSYSGLHRAPFTTAKGVMMEASAGDLEKWMIENIDNRPLSYMLVTVDEIIEALPRDIKTERGQRDRVADILRDKLKGENLGKVRMGGRAAGFLRLWALHKLHPDKPMAGKLSHSALAEGYWQERGIFTKAAAAERAKATAAAQADFRFR